MNSSNNLEDKIRILGIDPSMRRTGWGIIEVNTLGAQHINHGVIRIKETLSTELRLANLATEVEQLFAHYLPNIICIEETFCGVNPSTTLRLGFAFGVILSVFGKAKIAVHKYSTRLVKQLITGRGGATKDEVQSSVIAILGLDLINNLDSSDALAVAIAHYRLLNK